METPTFLYKPNFCVECGEKIERENWHFWQSRRFCDDCEPVYRVTRIVPISMLCVAFLFTGIFLAGSGQRYAQVPLKETPVVAAKKEPIEKPPTFVAKPAVENENKNTLANIAPEKPVVETNNAVIPAKPLMQPVRAEAKPDVVYICGARTQKGTPCSRRVKEPGRCWQHLGKPSMLDAPKY